MKWVYISMLYSSAAVILAVVIYDFRRPRHMNIEPPIRLMLSAASFALLMNGTAMLTSSLKIAYLLFGLYHFAMDFVLLGMMSFVRRYTGMRSYSKELHLTLSIAADIDGILMIVNCFYPIVFECELVHDNIGLPLYHVGDKGLVYLYHFVLVYFIALVSARDLIYKTKQSSKIYKIKYAGVFLMSCLIFVVHTMYLLFHFRIDYSMMWYAIIAMTIFYFSMFYIPRGLMDRLLFFTVSNIKDGIICLDIDGKCVHANKTAKTYCVNEINQQVQTWFKERLSDVDDSRSWSSIRRIEGEMRHYEIEYQKMFDVDGKYIGCFFIIHDCTEETNRLEMEKYRATHDALTGIYNKEHFYDVTRELIHKNSDIKYCIVCLDVKNFKIINDIFGIQIGDKLLMRIAGSIRSMAQEGWIYGRLSGDRFSICLPETQFDEERLLKEVNRMTKIPEISVFKIHMHIGVYRIEDPDLRISIMCDRANLAIKTIKESYQNVVAYYKETLREDFINEQKVISEFDKAIHSKQFQAYVQPQVFAHNGKICGGEVLVRWIHPIQGMIPPYKFIPIFEQTGLIGQLDQYMWELACIQLQKWQREGLTENYLSVNISQKDFYLLDVYQNITSLVERYGIIPKNLHLEITETAIMNNPSAQLPLINKLREYGFLIEIDDFGSGYSSLNTLKDLHADVLKIDMGFLRKTTHQERSKIILKMVISLAKALHMEVITEGVETVEQVAFLKESGCDIFQGYHFAKPMPMADFEKDYLNTIKY